MDELRGEVASSNASVCTGTVAEESANEGKAGEEGGANNGDDIMVEVLGSHVYVDGICTSDGGVALGNNLSDDVVGGQDNSVVTRLQEDESTRLDGEGRELISGGNDDRDSLEAKQEDAVEKDEGDRVCVQGVSIVNSAKDETQRSKEEVISPDTVTTSASGQPTESLVEGQLANKVQSDKAEQLEVDKQVGSEQQLVEIERHSVSSETHGGGSSNANVVHLFPEQSDIQLKSEAFLGPDPATGVLSIEEETDFKKPVSDDQKVNLSQDQEVQVNEGSVEGTVGDDTENTGIAFADSASLVSNASLLQSHVADLGEADMQNNNELSLNGYHGRTVEMARQQISGDDDATHAHFEGQDMNIEETVTGAEHHDYHSGQENNGEEQGIDHEEENNAEEETKTQAASTTDSSVKVHYAKYQLPPEDGEFCVSDLVWGKVRSHPWWPGQIFYPSDASEMATKHHKKDSFLVAYFGDRTFAWNEASLLKPFRTHFSAAEKQNNSEAFQNAVNRALEEVFRRVKMGLACSCTPKYINDNIKFQVVENTGIRQESSLKDVRDRSFTAVSFEPDKLLQYMKDLAQCTCGGADKLDLGIAKAQLSAFSCWRGYHPLPEFNSGQGLVETDASIAEFEGRINSGDMTDHQSPTDLDDEQVSTARKNLEPKRGSYNKRKHDLKGGLYPCKRERSLSELMGEAFDSLDTEGSDSKPEHMLASPSSSKKRKAIDSFSEEMVEEGRKTISLAKVSLTPQPPKPSFKIGECISRVASQMTGSPSVLKGPGERLQKLNGVNGDAADGVDLHSETYEDAVRKFSSSDELLSELRLAASDPMKDFSFLNVIVSFFHDFRNSLVLDHLPGDKEGGKRKRFSNSGIGSAETFEFEDMSDTYWTDRIVQNGSEEQLPHGNGRGQYQIVPVELEKPVHRGRKSRKRYSDGNHDVTAEKPPGYVNERAPAELVMTFSELNSVPSEVKLNKMFRHFGPLKESETEVDRETSRARVVFRRCTDAEVAFSSAEKFNIFGSVVVNYQLNYSISESFKASLYAPALPEETSMLSQTLDEHTPLIGSTPGDHNQLIVSRLGDEASFMVSTLADESLHLPPSFGEETSYMTVTLAEETSNVTAHAGEETFTISTTTGMEALVGGISENGTFGKQTSAIVPDPCEERTISDTIMGEQTSTGSITANEQTQTGSESFGEPTSTIATSICEQTACRLTVEEISTMPTSASKQNCTVTPFTREEQLNISTTFGEESSIDARTVSEQPLVDAKMQGEQSPSITASMGEEASDIAASLGQESCILRSSAEGTLNSGTTLGDIASTTLTTFEEKPSAVPATSEEEFSAGLRTSRGERFADVSDLGDKSFTEVTKVSEALPFDASLGEETLIVPVSLADKSLAAPTITVQETSVVPASSSEEPSTVPVDAVDKTLTVPVASGEETSSIAVSSGQEALAVPARSGEVISAVSTSFGEETSAVPAASGGETSAVPAASSEEPSAVHVIGGEKTSAATMASGDETLAVPATTEDLSTVPMVSGEENSTVPASTGEELSAIPMASGGQTSAVPMVSGEENSAVLATTGEELSAVPMTSGGEMSSFPMVSGEENSAVLATTGEELSAIPMTSGEETSTVPVVSGEETSNGPMVSGQETSNGPMVSGQETSAVPATTNKELSAVPVASGEETSAGPMVSGEEASAGPMASGQDASAVPVVSGEETSAVPVTSDEETSAVPVVSGEETSAVPVLSGRETSAVPVASGEETSAVLVASGMETSAVAAPFNLEPSAVPVIFGEETSAIPVAFGEKTSAALVASPTSAVPETAGDGTSAVATTSSGEKFATCSDPGDQSLTVGTTTKETLSFAATSSEDTLTVEITSIVSPTLPAGISTVATATGDRTSSSLATLGDATSAVINSVNGTASAAMTTLHETSSSIATIGEATSTVIMTLDETRSNVTAASDMETASAGNTQVEEYAT